MRKVPRFPKGSDLISCNISTKEMQPHPFYEKEAERRRREEIEEFFRPRGRERKGAVRVEVFTSLQRSQFFFSRVPFFRPRQIPLTSLTHLFLRMCPFSRN